MQDQIKKLRELAEESLTMSNVYAVHEKIEKMLVIIEQMPIDKAEDTCCCVENGPLCTENTLPEVTRAN